MTVGEIMTEEVHWITPQARVKDAAELMLQQCITGLPVMTLWRVLVGIVTEGDLLRRVHIKRQKSRSSWLKFMAAGGRLSDGFEQFAAQSVGDIMTRNVIVATESLALEAAVELMDHNHVKRLPVVREGNVVGILTRCNLIHALLATRRKAHGPDDQIIREQLGHALRAQPSRPNHLHLIVRDGVVHFWGLISNERQRAGIHAAAKQVPGVKDIRDGLLWYMPPPDGVESFAFESPVPPSWL